MRNALGWKIVVPALVLGMGMAAALVFAQEDSVPASQSMHRAGDSAENAASDTGQAIKHAYHGTVTAISDTPIDVPQPHSRRGVAAQYDHLLTQYQVFSFEARP